MTSILFVCHGNICRSAMAEYVMKKLVRDAGLSPRVRIASAATSTEELGNPVYPPVRSLLNRHGIDCAGHSARQLTRRDGEEYDLIIGMDEANMRNIRRICGDDCRAECRMLLDRAVADPWYTRDFEATWRDVNEGCRALLEKLQK